MGIQPDRHPGPSIEEELRLEEDTTDPTVPGALRYVSGSLRFRDAVGVFNPRMGSGGITEEQHEIIDTLTHGLAESCYTEIIRTSGLVSSVTVYTNSGKATLVRKLEITRSGGIITQTIFRVYDGAGDEITAKRLTTTYTRSAGRVVDYTMTEGA